jgi:hypothetical protein
MYMRSVAAKQIGAILAGLPCLALCAICFAHDPTDAIRSQIVQQVREVCTQPATQSQHWSVVGDANRSVGVDVRLLKVAEASGELHFTREEWSGVQGVLAKDQAHDNDGYRHCAETITALFIAKSGSHFSYPYKEACMHGDLALAVTGCEKYASNQFLECNQFSAACKLRANCWSDKGRAMRIVRDACEGTNGDRSPVNAQLCRIGNRSLQSTL